MSTTQGGSPAPDGGMFPLYHHWRAYISQASSTFGGIAWQPSRLYAIHRDTQEALVHYVGISEPSPFKRAAAFAVAFMDSTNYPITGEFKHHSYRDRLSSVPRWSGAVLVFEYLRYFLDGATINKRDAETVVLTNPIKVSEHTYMDTIQAFTHLRKHCAADFHLAALLIEQLVYLENPEASYPREV